MVEKVTFYTRTGSSRGGSQITIKYCTPKIHTQDVFQTVEKVLDNIPCTTEKVAQG